MRDQQYSLPLAAALLSLAACGVSQPAEPDLAPPLPVFATGGSLVPLDQFGVGLTGPGVRGCRGEPFQEFAFWAGTWDVYNGANVLAGNSRVLREADGCAMIENWTSAGGGQGKSLNSYDAATGTWHQLWVANNGCPFSVVAMQGGLEQGRMVLEGTREQPLGFLVAPPCGPPPGVVATSRTDRFRWSRLPGGEVLQQVSGSINGAIIPPFGEPDPSLGLRYVPVASVTPIPVPAQPASYCPFRAAARQFDFLVGNWRVHRGNGQGSPGTATVTKSMANCLVEERLSGPGGHEGVSFSTFDVFSQKWIRSYVDNAGQWLFLTGKLVNGRMVLEGTRPGSAGRTVTVRVTWEPVGPGQVVQHWELSEDGGTTWTRSAEVHFDAVQMN